MASPATPLHDPAQHNPPANSQTTLPPGHGQRAAQQAANQNSNRVTLPVLGTLELPPTEELAYIGGVGALAVVGVMEWPIAASLALGHLFASSRRNKTLRDFGSALEEA